MDSGHERHPRPTATAVAAPDTTVPRQRTAPTVESAAPARDDLADDLTDDLTDTGPIPVVPSVPTARPPYRTLLETDPVGFDPVTPDVTARTAAAPGDDGTTTTPPVTAPVTNPCRCGHGRDAHEHFRRGTDCAGCDCARFRRPSLLNRLRG